MRSHDLVVGIEGESDLALQVQAAQVEEGAVADQLRSRLEHDSEAEVLALGADRRLADLPLQRGAHLVFAHRLPVEVADDLGLGVDREQRVEVLGDERPQEQPVRLPRVLRFEPDKPWSVRSGSGTRVKVGRC